MLLRKIFLFVFLIPALLINAQIHLIGIKSGVNLTNISNANNITYSILNERIEYKFGFTGGLSYEYVFKNKISLGVDLLYEQKGFEYKSNFIYGDPLDPVRGYISEIVPPLTPYNQYDFISLPIKISYTFGRNLYGYSSIGFMPSYLIATKHYYDNHKYEINSTIEKAKRFEFSGLAELGVGYQFKKRWHVVFSTNYFYAFNGINGTNYYLYDNIKNYGFNASLGLKYQLGKYK